MLDENHFQLIGVKEIKELISGLDSFLQVTLDGYHYLECIDQGNAETILEKPKQFRLNHISSYPDAWADDNTIIMVINGGVHFCFIQVDRVTNTRGLQFINGKW
ncbi:hypothetical protein LIT32_27210 (plasmid) [Bacillus sp. CMF21]|nr:hypothetical protein LIT32_27210 [Bacillus sp. CMF21]